MTAHDVALDHPAHTPEEARRHVRTYIFVFVSLAILTVVTVAVASLHLPTWQAVTVALVIASVKGTLVASFFMHLLSEKSLIKFSLILTAVMFVFLLLIPVITTMNNKQY